LLEQQPVRLGIVGCGGISNAHAKAAANSNKDIRFVACCDVREDAARDWAARYGCDSVYVNYEDMIHDEELDGMLLATWPNQHRRQLEDCLQAGARNILCEKALTLTRGEAMEIWQMAKDAGALLMEGFMYRHHPAIARLEDILAGGELGPVDSVRGVFSAYDPETAPPGDPNRGWRQRRECGGGVPYDYACYAVNACNHFAGDVPVRALAIGTVGKYDTLNRLFGLIEYAGGSTSILESSKKGAFSQELQISCAKGILNLPVAWTIYSETAVRLIRSPEWGRLEAETFPVEAADAYQLQLENFAAAIRERARPRVALIESVVNTFTLEALVNSAQERKALEIAIPEAVSQALLESKREAP